MERPFPLTWLEARIWNRKEAAFVVASLIRDIFLWPDGAAGFLDDHH
jgi:hypothetical protein